MNSHDCEHDALTYKRTDTDGTPDAVYVEWACDDCGALISEIYEPTGRALVFHHPDDEPEEVTL